MAIELFHIGNYPITAFALGLFLSASICVALFLLVSKNTAISSKEKQIMVILTLLTAPFVGHLLLSLIQIEDVLAMYSPAYFFTPWAGGNMLYGLLLALLLSAFVTKKSTKSQLSPFTYLDEIAPFVALFIALERFLEPLDGMGEGMQMMEERFFFFPLSYPKYEGEWYIPVFFFEGLVALLLCLYLLFSKKKRQTKEKSMLLLLVYASFQILFETLRRDQVVKWGFIRISQLLSVLALAFLLFYAFKCQKKEDRKILLPVCLFLLFTALCVGLEFTVDKPIPIFSLKIYLPYTVTYGLIFAFGMGMGLISYKQLKKAHLLTDHSCKGSKNKLSAS